MMNPLDLHKNIALDELDKIMKPHRAFLDSIAGVSQLIPHSTFNYLKDITDTQNVVREQLGITDFLLDLTNKWTVPTQVNQWQDIGPLMERWNEVLKPQMMGVSMLSPGMTERISAVEFAYSQVADILRPMKPLSVQFNTFDFVDATLAEIESEERDEVAIEKGLSVLAAFLDSIGNDISQSTINLKRKWSAFELQIVDAFKGHPITLGILLILINYYSDSLLDLVNGQPPLLTPKVEAKAVTPVKKKKIVYDKLKLEDTIETKK